VHRRQLYEFFVEVSTSVSGLADADLRGGRVYDPRPFA
jgi:hypothetical protein